MMPSLTSQAMAPAMSQAGPVGGSNLPQLKEGQLLIDGGGGSERYPGAVALAHAPTPAEKPRGGANKKKATAYDPYARAREHLPESISPRALARERLRRRKVSDGRRRGAQRGHAALGG